MGIEIDRDEFEPAEFARFDARLARCLAALETLLARPGFGTGEPSLGAELEVTLVDAQGRPLPLNHEVLDRTLDPRMTYELDRFNLECNLRHTRLAGNPFAHLRSEFASAHRELSRAASAVGGRIAMIGILPTLEESDLEPGAMTESARFRALSRALRTARHGAFRLHIDGDDPLRLDCEDVTFEGAATSFQVHLRVDPHRFASVFNAAQLVTAPVLAAAGNSPIFLAHRLWAETRVALFKQSVDARLDAERQGRREPRVSFGSDWNHGGALELFKEAVARFPALLPMLGDDDPDASLREGRVPKLEEMRLHQGTVWRWNRPVYDPHDGGHLRIEMRALPSGPGIEDMLANAAFLVGATLGLAPQMHAVVREFDFALAHANFYRAAQLGLSAELYWPRSLGGSDAPMSAHALLPKLRDTALRGLLDAGVAADEATPLIDLFTERVRRRRTGASWQRETLEALESRGRTRREALVEMLERYLELSRADAPVHAWPVP